MAQDFHDLFFAEIAEGRSVAQQIMEVEDAKVNNELFALLDADVGIDFTEETAELNDDQLASLAANLDRRIASGDYIYLRSYYVEDSLGHQKLLSYKRLMEVRNFVRDRFPDAQIISETLSEWDTSPLSNSKVTIKFLGYAPA